MLNWDTVRSYHAHLYYNLTQLDQVNQIRAGVEKEFQVALGRVHQVPVGPHPGPSMQIAFAKADFAKLVTWLMANRGDIDVLVHVLTGDDIEDHTRGVMWLGKSYELNLEALR